MIAFVLPVAGSVPSLYALSVCSWIVMVTALAVAFPELRTPTVRRLLAAVLLAFVLSGLGGAFPYYSPCNYLDPESWWYWFYGCANY